jgi:hypothetical protein
MTDPTPSNSLQSDNDADKEAFCSWTQVEQRMAFYAGIYKHGRGFRGASPSTLAAWRRGLPAAIDEEHRRIETGALPRTLSFNVVQSTADQQQQPRASPSGAH